MGLDGITNRMGLLSLPGVCSVKLRLLGRLFGGVGGLMNPGDPGADTFSEPPNAGTALRVLARRFPSELDVLIPRFFRFLGFFAGVVGLCNSKKVFGDESPEPLSVLRDRKSATNEVLVGLGSGDSGDGPGEGSVTEAESMVEMVVVGELSVDSDASVDVLSRWAWKAANAGFEAPAPPRTGPLVAGRATEGPWEAVVRCACDTRRLLTSSPNTDINVGIGGAALVDWTMLGWRRLV